MSFKQKICAMSAREIILAVVDAIENPVIKLDMGCFGRIDGDGACVACASTNAIAKIAGVTFEQETITSTNHRADKVNAEWRFFDRLEMALNYLRCGDVSLYDSVAIRIGIAQIENYDDIQLPMITNENFTDPATLEPYKRLAELQN